ncbi:carbohydrate ABC transporter permease [Streptomyces sp. NBC_01260]|uniref:carbohydrate ABC transporter permease n=1 Tax=Streptomyces sp. NBC_01260 TaxID=2903801 RepID=UPI002E37680F|nr:carbohydrate ABC transporter permease [Streptomyces sp. NBC_01260]
MIPRRHQVLTTALLSVVACYFLLPVWWLIVSAGKSSSDLFATNGLLPADDFALADNVRAVFTWDHGIFADWMVHSLLYAVLGAAAATLLSGGAGYVLAKYAFRGREVVFSVIIAAVLVPIPLLTLPLYLVFAELHLTDTVWSVLIPSAVSPFGVYLARIYAADSVPNEILEAARVDGAGELRIFFQIVTRLMSPGLVTVFLFQFVAIWNNFFLPLVMLSDHHKWPAILGLFYWNSQPLQLYYNITITGALISVLPLVLAFLTLQRYWRSGLSAGSGKL